MKSSSAKKLAPKSLPLKQRGRLQPSLAKPDPDRISDPAERLRLALELSDFCLLLREAVQRKM